MFLPDDGSTALLNPQKKKPLQPDITATTANGPLADVPAPAIGAPSSMPVLKAPTAPASTTADPQQAPQSVAQMALGTSAAGTGSRSDPNGPNLGSSGMGAMPQGETIQSLVASAGQNAPKPPLAPKALDTPPAGGLAGWTPSATPPVVSGGSSPGARWTTFDASKSAAMSPEDAALNARIQSGDPALMNEYKQKYGADWFSKWGADQDRLAAMKNNQTGGGAGLQNLGGLSGQDAWNKISGNLENFNALRAMSPEQRTAFLDQWKPGTYDRQLMEGSLASQGITPANADTGRRWDGKTANMGAMASAIPVYDQIGGGPAANVQGEAFPGYNPATGKIDQPSGPAPQIAPPTGPATGSPIGPSASLPPSGSGGVGGGAPGVGVGPSGTPAFPSTPAPSVGAPGDMTNLDPVQQAMRAETLRRLQNPSPYDDALWQAQVDKAKASSDETWRKAGDNLTADLAQRGINWSSVAGDKFSDFNTAKGRSWDDTLTGFLKDRANGIAAARDQAFNAGNTERNYYDNLRQQAIANQFDVTKLAEALRQGKEGTAIDWTRLGLDALGNSTAGAADLGAGAAASAGNTGTGDYIAQWLAQFYGKNAPKPAVAKPVATTYPTGAYG